MKIFAHRGFYGCTDINQEHLTKEDVKGENLKNTPPENSEQSIIDAFDRNFNIEIDVVMTKDRELIVTHTNELALHSLNAKREDFASQMLLEDILKMQTGMGGKTSPYLTYDKFLSILEKYKNLTANVEIKGNIHPKLTMNELENPTIVEKLVEKTPQKLFKQIIWSSFSFSNLIEIRNLNENANIAMLFYPQCIEETKIYTNKTDLFMQFNLQNIKMIHNTIPNINAVHPCIDSLINEDVIKFCVNNNITIRPWILFEKNPQKNHEAKDMILKVKELQHQHDSLNLDIITDFPNEVKSLIEI